MVYLLVCRECECPEWDGAKLPLVEAFSSPEARGKWAAAHLRETGHAGWWVKDVPYQQAGARPA